MGGDGGRDKVQRYRVWELGFQQQTDPRSSGGVGWEGDPDQTWLLWKGLNLDAGNILGFAQRQGRRDIYVFALGLYRLFFLIHKAGEGGLEGEEQRRPSQ